MAAKQGGGTGGAVVEPDNAVDPATIGSGGSGGDGSDGAGSGSDSGGAGTGKRGRGRPRKEGTSAGSGSAGSAKAKAASAPLDLSGLESIFVSLHMMAATAMKNPILAIDADEAASLAKAISMVSRHYNVSKVSAQTVDWMNLLMVLMTVYGTRFVALKAANKPAAAPPAPQHGFTVIPGSGG